MIQRIAKLHQTYVDLTGLRVSAIIHQRTWLDFINAGFTEADLVAVLNWIKRQNAKNDYQYSTRLSKLVGNLANFDELNAQAHLRQTAPVTASQRTLDTFRGFNEGPPTTTNIIPLKEALQKAVNQL